MKNIHINGELHAFEAGQVETLAHALALFFNGQAQSTFALALNGNFVGKSDYASTPVSSGDSIDIMLPIQGG